MRDKIFEYFNNLDNNQDFQNYYEINLQSNDLVGIEQLFKVLNEISKRCTENKISILSLINKIQDFKTLEEKLSYLKENDFRNIFVNNAYFEYAENFKQEILQNDFKKLDFTQIININIENIINVDNKDENKDQDKEKNINKNKKEYFDEESVDKNNSTIEVMKQC
ncbi:hypothetical protein CRU99_07710 [Malaciobacter mytili]|uniref:hypothetical protein n=1 Tax=Malaciobacter mytili TaxID=603050 RepID=UPI00100B0DD0|nr:hypothetical protein [Malaciobacter mytili]RXI43411.1 hypothetical protein CRU99_07710 [Malaciobacter mytili]